MRRNNKADFDFELHGSQEWNLWAKRHEADLQAQKQQQEQEELEARNRAYLDEYRNSEDSVAHQQQQEEVREYPQQTHTQQPPQPVQYQTRQSNITSQNAYPAFPVEPIAPAQSGHGGAQHNSRSNRQRQNPNQYQRNNGLPNVREMERRRDDGYMPEELILDNEASRRHKQGVKADDEYNFSFFFPTGFKGTFYGAREINLKYISYITNTYIAPSREDIHVVDIWGSPDDIEQAKEDLYALGQISLQALSQGVSRAREKFGKNRAAPTEIEAKKIAKLQAIEEKRIKFRTLPEDLDQFPVVGVFTWPVGEINPEDHLGTSLQGLDDIRMDHECYTEFNRTNGAIYVYGQTPKYVQTALDRIYGVLCEIATMQRCLGTTTKRFHITIPPGSDDIRSHIFMEENHDLVGRQITVHKINSGAQCKLHGLKPTSQYMDNWATTHTTLTKANAVFFKKLVQRGLNDTLYLRTQLHMKVNFGKLVLFSYARASNENGTHELDKFLTMMRDSAVQSELIRDIGPPRVAQELINICRVRGEIFRPIHPYSQTIIGRPEGMYSATFELRLTDRKVSTAMRLECDFGPEQIVGNKRQHTAVSGRWLNLPRQANQRQSENDNEKVFKRKGPLDVKVMDLAKNLAWQLEISSYARLRDADQYKTLVSFLSHLTLEIDIPTGTDQNKDPLPIINYINLDDTGTNLTVVSVVIKSKYQWFISATNYVFEVVRYDYYAIPIVKQTPQGIRASVSDQKPDSRWGASLTSRDWVEGMGIQWDLPVGIPGKWKPDIQEFFRPTNVGGIDDPLVDGIPAPREEWVEDGFEEFKGRIEECLGLILHAQRNAQKRWEMEAMGVHEDDMD